MRQLKALRELIANHQQELIDAISSDFGHRSADETLLAEIMPSLHGIRYASRHLRRWMNRRARRRQSRDAENERVDACHRAAAQGAAGADIP